MTESLDTILSGQKDSAQAQDTTSTVETETQVATEQVGQEVETDSQPAEGDRQGQKMVPHEALHAEKQKVKRYTEQIASFEETLKQRDQAWERRFGQLLERLTPQQQAQAQQPVNPWDDLDGAINQRSQAVITPVMQQLNTLQTDIARLQAERALGDKFSDFMEYVKEANAKGDPELKALEAMMASSPDPYGVAKQWFEKRTFNPEAERERIRQELLTELKAQQTQQGTSQQQPVMPSNLAGARNVGNRSGPTWSGPPALTDIFQR